MQGKKNEILKILHQRGQIVKKKDEGNKSKRSDIWLKCFEETKLLNFFNIGGIRFQNIAVNEAVVSSKIDSLSEEEWELAFVNGGVESFGGKGYSIGVFATRYVFKRLKTYEAQKKTAKAAFFIH